MKVDIYKTWKNNKIMYIVWFFTVILTLYSGIYLRNDILFWIGAIISTAIVSIKGPVGKWK